MTTQIGYAMHSSRSHDALIRVYDAVGNVIETHPALLRLSAIDHSPPGCTRKVFFWVSPLARSSQCAARHTRREPGHVPSRPIRRHASTARAPPPERVFPPPSA